MSNFNGEYFFIVKSRDERLPSMTPDENTATLNFDYSKVPIGSKPLIFHNGAFGFQKFRQIPIHESPPDFLFFGSDILVKDEIKDELIREEIPNLAIQPAIYIDHNNSRHEDRWFLTFLDEFDCWDRNNSFYAPEPVDLDYTKQYAVINYSLNDSVISKVPLESRKLFKMGGTADGFVVAHISITSLFRGSGATLVPVPEYGISFP